ncbi:short-chain dehydrogenase/reductase SDR [Fimicolochytrium jonesii]|uniref:short-chain dehydrogenase/reductase SDR n=1 Tax=Fimicolochytrium jonesii TaxID=1396493 RepID=UPI0022FF0732|nr:short-chain dehydrogenase/reductase SDR [Fimicolochytrium jonesii]KAI8817087.1 short-chain dehydrogenase/reductase SDR [Fimicolochytrium jonesii]
MCPLGVWGRPHAAHFSQQVFAVNPLCPSLHFRHPPTPTPNIMPTYLPSFSLSKKTALVTGAGRGIGKALAIGLAEAGADVAIIARTSADLDAVADEIRKLGRQCYPVTADLSQKDAAHQIVDSIVSQLPPGRHIDILINNAGTNIRNKALDVTSDEWDTIMSTNLKSAFTLSQSVAAHMKHHNVSGRIINISSVAGSVALRTGVVYGASKAALDHMTRILSLEWAPFNIRVNAIGPWYFRTPLTEGVLGDEKYLGSVLERTPMGRIGEVAELVGPAVFLASDASAYVTGQVLLVDGGMSVFGF